MVLLHIQARTGADIHDIAFHKTEGEVLLRKGTQYIIRGVRSSNVLAPGEGPAYTEVFLDEDVAPTSGSMDVGAGSYRMSRSRRRSLKSRPRGSQLLLIRRFVGDNDDGIVIATGV